MTADKITLSVVEDEILIRWDMVYLLEGLSFAVLQAETADEAIFLLISHPEIRGVLSDVDLPGTMNGIQLVSIISKRWPPCRLILVSGMHAPRAETLPEGTCFIPKPVSDAALKRTLSALNLAV